MSPGPGRTGIPVLYRVVNAQGHLRGWDDLVDAGGFKDVPGITGKRLHLPDHGIVHSAIGTPAKMPKDFFSYSRLCILGPGREFPI